MITPALPPGASQLPSENANYRSGAFYRLGSGHWWRDCKREAQRQIYDALPGGGDAGATDPGFRSEHGQGDLTVGGKVIQLPVYPKSMPLSRFGEALRALRSGIRMTDVDDPPKVIQLTSTIPGEGKTTLACR